MNIMEKQTAPNAVASLVLGIVSIVFGCLPFVSLICGIIGLALSVNGKKKFAASPDEYTGYGMLNAGFITSIIGTALSALCLIYWIVAIMIFGTNVAVMDWQQFMNV